jgi:CTP synthase
VEGKLTAIQYAREHKIPSLGLCFGMQLALIEFARLVVGLEGAHTTEVDPHTPHPVVHQIPPTPARQTITGEGASRRLGAYDAVIKPGTLTYQIYHQAHAFKDPQLGTVSERHRHRFEVNNAYREQLATKGMIFSGTSPDDFFVEMIELPPDMHPFFLATQGHPEYKTRPLAPHPFFSAFIQAALRQRQQCTVNK